MEGTEEVDMVQKGKRKMEPGEGPWCRKAAWHPETNEVRKMVPEQKRMGEGRKRPQKVFYVLPIVCLLPRNGIL